MRLLHSDPFSHFATGMSMAFSLKLFAVRVFIFWHSLVTPSTKVQDHAAQALFCINLHAVLLMLCDKIMASACDSRYEPPFHGRSLGLHKIERTTAFAVVYHSKKMAASKSKTGSELCDDSLCAMVVVQGGSQSCLFDKILSL